MEQTVISLMKEMKVENHGEIHHHKQQQTFGKVVINGYPDGTSIKMIRETLHSLSIR